MDFLNEFETRMITTGHSLIKQFDGYPFRLYKHKNNLTVVERIVTEKQSPIAIVERGRPAWLQIS